MIPNLTFLIRSSSTPKIPALGLMCPVVCLQQPIMIIMILLLKFRVGFVDVCKSLYCCSIFFIISKHKHPKQLFYFFINTIHIQIIAHTIKIYGTVSHVISVISPGIILVNINIIAGTTQSIKNVMSPASMEISKIQSAKLLSSGIGSGSDVNFGRYGMITPRNV